jgi:hypothetical protein
MLKVTVELISAITGQTSELGRMYIANDGEASREDPKVGDYNVAVCRKGSTAVPKPVSPRGPRPARGGFVEGYPRLSHNIWRLVTRALHVAFPEEIVQAKRKAGDAPRLDAAVMRGLNWLRDHALHRMGEAAYGDDIAAAEAWLDAAKHEGDT